MVLITSKTFIYTVYLLCVFPLVQVVHVLFVVREYYPCVPSVAMCWFTGLFWGVEPSGGVKVLIQNCAVLNSVVVIIVLCLLYCLWKGEDVLWTWYVEHQKDTSGDETYKHRAQYKAVLTSRLGLPHHSFHKKN